MNRRKFIGSLVAGSTFGITGVAQAAAVEPVDDFKFTQLGPMMDYVQFEKFLIQVRCHIYNIQPQELGPLKNLPDYEP